MVIPAMRGHLGTMIFYTANLRLKELVKLVNYGNRDKLCCSDLSQETYLYALADNGFKIKDHLLAYNGLSFNAIVLVVCDGDPRWREIRLMGRHRNERSVYHKRERNPEERIHQHGRRREGRNGQIG